MNWRWYLFWFRDFIKGRHIYKAYKDVEKVYYQQHDSYIDKKINNLIQTAKKNTKYYSNINSDNIKDFPIISKVIINENYTDFLSKHYKKEELHAINTSGSTGIPFTILQNKEKRNRVIAELLFFDKICNYYFGEKQIFFRIWTEKNKKSTFQKFLQNMITEDISNLNEESLKEKALKLQKKYKVSNIISYASTLDVLSNYLLKSNCKPDDFSIKSIISGSEILQDTTREKLKKLFNCNIVSRYSYRTHDLKYAVPRFVLHMKAAVELPVQRLQFLRDHDDDKVHQSPDNKIPARAVPDPGRKPYHKRRKIYRHSFSDLFAKCIP